MSFPLSLPKLIHVVDAVCLNADLQTEESATEITGINTDSRTIKAGEIFVALEGDTFDGHAFVEKAHQCGSVAAIVRHIPSGMEALPIPLLQVKNTLTAYQAIAHWWRHQLDLPVIAVTGSVGKTTTKELISAVLALNGKVLKTQANYNNEVGVPKTLLQLNQTHHYAVVEMGMRGPGEIAELTNIATPDIAVITNVGTAHIGRLGSEEAIARAKCELIDHLSPQGTAILNADNALLVSTARTIWNGRTITYGLNGKSDIQGTLLDNGRLQVTGLSVSPIEIVPPLKGAHNATNYLAALAVAHVLGIDTAQLLDDLTDGLQITMPPGRAQIIHLPNDIILLDETYNAGFESMRAALKLLMKTPGSRHIAVVGTMKELGDWSVKLHHRLGETARSLGVDHLVILADPAESDALVRGAEGIPSHPCADKAEVLAKLSHLAQSGDRILFKASHSVGLDQVVQEFKRLHDQ